MPFSYVFKMYMEFLVYKRSIQNFDTISSLNKEQYCQRKDRMYVELHNQLHMSEMIVVHMHECLRVLLLFTP